MIPKSVEIIRREHNKHWQVFRAEAAREFTAALIHVVDWANTSNENIVKSAIDLADELVKQLKEKGGEE